MPQFIARIRSTRSPFTIAGGAALLLGSLALTMSHPAFADPISGVNPSSGTGLVSPSSGSPNPESKTRQRMVNVFATVRDKKGKVVSDLTSNDFILSEDGRPQSLQYFAKSGSQPLTVGLLVDTSPGQNRELDQERSASGSFFDQMVHEETDKAFVIHFDREVELLQDLTASHQKLEQALVALQTPQFKSSQDSNSPDPDSTQTQGGRGAGMRSHGGAQLYDAVYLASDELMKKQTGRKALILLSDGVDSGSKETLDHALEAAQRANTIIYTVLLKSEEENQGGGNRVGFGLPGMGGGGMGRRGGSRAPQENRPDPKKTLEQISRQTGGRLFEASRKDTLDQIYSQIEEDLRNQYNLGYTPDRAEATDVSYHKLSLTTAKKDLAVQVREGYYSETTP
jgi:VWFA-related protein